MVYLDKNRLEDPDFLNKNLLDLYNQLFREGEQALTAEELIEEVRQRNSAVDPGALGRILQTKLRVSAGVIPVAVCPDGSVRVITGLSQRTGPQARGIVLSGFGRVEPDDPDLQSGALREFEEELGTRMHDVVAENISHGHLSFCHTFGGSRDEAEETLARYALGKINKVSIYSTIAVPFFIEEDELERLMAESNHDLSMLSDVYQLAVNVVYQGSKQNYKTAHAIIPDRIRDHIDDFNGNIKETLQRLLDEYDAGNDKRKGLAALCDYVIEISENKQLVSLSLEHVQAVTAEAVQFSDSKTVKMGDRHFFRADFASNHQLMRDVEVTIAARYVNQFIIKMLDISRHHNPFILRQHERNQRELSDHYQRHSKRSGAFLKHSEIPSHVNAARTDRAVRYITLTPGCVITQFVKPRFYIGDYSASDAKATPSQLGISPQVTVTDVTPQQTIDRVKVHLVTTKPFVVCVNEAAAVKDFWSIPGRRIDCAGGAQQLHMDLTPAQKNEHLAILLTGDDAVDAQLREIATKNNMQCHTRQDYINQGVDLRSAKAYISDLNPVKELASTTSRVSADISRHIESGEFHLALNGLAAYPFDQIPTMPRGKTIKTFMMLLQQLVGQFSDAEKLQEQLIEASLIVGDDAWVKLYCLFHQPSAQHAISGLRALMLVTPDFKPKLFSRKLRLVLAMRLNQVGQSISNEVTYADFDESGKMHTRKYEVIDEAIAILQSLDEDALGESADFYEIIIIKTELAFAYYRRRYYVEAMDLLEDIRVLLRAFMKGSRRDDRFSEGIYADLELHYTAINMMIVLSRSHDRRTLPPPPRVLKRLSPNGYLIQFIKSLSVASPLKVKLLLRRIVGDNPNDLFIEGWHQNKSMHRGMGTELIEQFRRFLPLDIDVVAQSLVNNTVSQLNLAHLGLPEPTGISNEKFTKFCDALAINTSLTHLYVKRFSTKACPERTNQLFDALSRAQERGQRLVFLSYAGIVIRTPEAHESVIRFLAQNESLLVLQPSLSDYITQTDMQPVAAAIAGHRTLRTLVLGLLFCEGGARILRDEILRSNTCQLRYLYPYPGKLKEDTACPIRENNQILFELKESLEARQESWRSYLARQLTPKAVAAVAVTACAAVTLFTNVIDTDPFDGDFQICVP